MAPRDYYNPIATVAPQERPTPKIREEFPHVQISDAVGQALANIGTGYGTLGRATAEVGQAMDSLGTQTKNAGNELWEKAVALKALESDKKVDDLVMAYNQKQTEIGEKFRTAEGVNASPEALQAHIKESADLRTGMRGGLTPYEQRKFDSESRGIFNQDTSRSLLHSAQQVHHGLMATSAAKVSMLQDRVAKATTQKELDDAHSDLGDELVRQSHLYGWTPEQAEFNTYKEVSKATSMWINNRSDEEPTKAMAILESAYKAGNITEADYQKLKPDVQNKIDVQVGREAGNKAMKDPDLPLAKQEELAKKYAAESTDRPEAAEKAVNNVRREFGIKRQAQVDQNRRDTDLLNEWIAGMVLPDGKKPTMEEEAGVDDNVKAAWERQAGQRRKWLKALADNSKEDYVQTPANVTRFDQLMGMSYNPEKRDEFRDMAADIMGEKMPMSFKKQLLARQREIAAKGQDAMDNPKVERVIGVLRADGVLSKEFQQDSSTMDMFRGKVHNAIQKFEADKRGPSTDEEKLKIGRTLLKEVQGTGWFGSNVGAQKVYEKMGVNAINDIPINWAKQYRESGTYKDDETMLNDYAKWYFIKQYDKLFGGRPVSEGTVRSK